MKAGKVWFTPQYPQRDMLLGIILLSFVLSMALTLFICDKIINSEIQKRVKQLRKELGYEND